jgi:prepilin-type N-terminal cleavage/methylation domain-containing protein
MNRNRDLPAPLACGFTLLELVIVITILGVLVTMLFGAIGKTKEFARRAQSRHDVLQIVSAVNAYYAEYAAYPIPPEQSGAEVSYTTDNSELFNTLRGLPLGRNADHVLNPRQVDFIQIPNASNSANPRSGLAHGCWYDPWGPQPGKAESGVYHIRLDGSYQGQVTDPYPGHDDDDDDESDSESQGRDTSSEAAVIHTGVIAWSLAKGGVQTYKLVDQIISWK